MHEALQKFFEAAGHDPKNPLNHYLSGLALRALGLQEEARAEWEEVLTLTLHQEVLSRTSRGTDEFAPQSQWVFSMAQRLLKSGAASEERPPETVAERSSHD